ncbi:MAG: carboxypeptidase regulatory-like domain-containing protein [Acidobacteriales bacterium]|nr:carboxypeptidase regulatory-like domain-containing protein [Terriglobales bacterium]
MFRYWRVVSLFVLAFAGTCLAQPTATIVGRVRDATGATIPGAGVTTKNVDTGQVRTTITTETGDFELPLLPITGSYTLTISKDGFQTHEVGGITLQVDQRARFDVTLNVGSTTERITVTEEAPITQTESGAVGQVIGNKRIVDLPLNGRNFVQLASLIPNAIITTSGFGSPMVTVSGGRSSKTEFLLDGISTNEQLFDGVAVLPSVDAIQEFKVQANSFSAEYGRGNAIVNATIKGGTNEFHGVVYEFIRNDKLDARNFFIPRKGAYRQNQFGVAAGGPVLLPGYNGKDRSFFFLNYEGLRVRRGLAFNPVVPNAAFRRGDFSAVSTVVRDPLTGTAFPGNQVPAGRINPSTSFFHQFIPEPNTPAGTFSYAAAFRDTRDQGNARYDQKLGEKDNLFVRYTIAHREAFNPGQYPQNGGFSNRNRNQNVALQETHIFSPTLINELRLGYTRWHNANLNQGLGTNYTAQAGIRGYEETSLNFPGFPQLSITGFNGVAGNAFQPIVNPTNLYEIIDNVSIIRGAHTIRVGADLRKYELSSTNSATSRGSFSFSPNYTGLAYADFLTGFPTSGARAFPRNHFGLYESRYHFYIQDDWKVSNNLTLNIGLRYELNIQPTGKEGQTAKFDFDTGRWIVSTFKGQINLVTQQVAKFAYPRFQSLIDSPPEKFGLPNKLLFNDYNDWAPRIGIAWRPFGNNKTVVRAGGGVFYLLQSGNNIVSAPIINVPFIVDESKQQPVVGGRPTLQVQNFFEPFSVNANFTTPLTFGVNPHFPTPLLQQWNLAVQRELVKDLSLEVAYVGNKGTHLERTLPENLPRVSSTDLRPFQERRPRPQFGTGSFYDNRENSNYNALEVKLEKRYSKGYSFLVGYFWGKTIDGSTNDQGGGEGADNPFDLRSMRGRSSLDVGQRFISSFGVELPFGKGKPIGGGVTGMADKIISGWQVAGIITFQGGFPFTPTIASDPANVAFTYARRPDVTGTGRVDECRPERCFNINDFRVPAPYTIGNAGRNILRGPGINNWDVSFLKDVHVTEQTFVQFRAEFFNFFNHTQFNNPNNNIELPAVGGRVFSAKDPRIGQFGLKLYW